LIRILSEEPVQWRRSPSGGFVMVAGPLATISREPGQARKGSGRSGGIVCRGVAGNL